MIICYALGSNNNNNNYIAVNPILSAKLLCFNFYELSKKGFIWIVSDRAFVYK